jgi:hypothetical protein
MLEMSRPLCLMCVYRNSFITQVRKMLLNEINDAWIRFRQFVADVSRQVSISRVLDEKIQATTLYFGHGASTCESVLTVHVM